MSDRSQRRALPIVLAALLALCLTPIATSAATAASPGKSQSAQSKRRSSRRKSSKGTSKPSAGGALLSGKRAPTARTGKPGDFYLRTSDHSLYGPKTKRGWGKPTPLVGPQGAQGVQGAQGPQGAAGTPAFGSGRLVSFAPAALTGTYDEDGMLVSTPVEVGGVQIPAGPALVQLRTTITPGAGFDPRSSVSCTIGGPSFFVVGSWTSLAVPADEEIGWTSLLAPATLTVTCSITGFDGTPGETASAIVSGLQVVVFPANVPAL